MNTASSFATSTNLVNGPVSTGVAYDPLTLALSSLTPSPVVALGKRFVTPSYLPLESNKFSGFTELRYDPTPHMAEGTPVAVHIDFELSGTTKFVETNSSAHVGDLIANPIRLFDQSAGALYSSTDSWYYVGTLKKIPSDPNTPSLSFTWDATHHSAPSSTTADGITVDITVTITSLSASEMLVLAPPVQSQ